MNFFKRAVSYIIFKIIFIVPITISWSLLSLPITSTYMQVTHAPTDGFYLIGLFFISILLPVNGWQILSEISEGGYYLTTIPLFTVILCYILYEFFVLLFYRDKSIRMFYFKCILINNNGLKPNVCELLIRTIIKYLTITFFCPLLLFPLFNKKRLFLHEIVSGVKKVEVTADKVEKPSKHTQFIDEEERVFYENQDV